MASACLTQNQVTNRAQGEDTMDLKLHHINLSTNNVAGMSHFYRDILGLKTETQDLPVLEKNKGYNGEVSLYLTDRSKPIWRKKTLMWGFALAIL